MNFDVKFDELDSSVDVELGAISPIKGKDGFSPIATVEQTETGATVTVTDVNGTTTATLTNGAQGDKGDKGAQGKDGAAGADGKTPVKGTDYWTDADKSEIVADTKEAIDLSSYAKKTELDKKQNKLSGNVGTAYRPIYQANGVLKNVTSVESSYIGWNQTAHTGLSALEKLMDSAMPNVLTFCKPAGVTIEYTTDGGTTWTDYGGTDGQKAKLFLGDSWDFALAKGGTLTAGQSGLRITISSDCGVYCNSTMILINHRFAHYVNIEVQGAKYGTPDTFSTIVTVNNVSGNPNTTVIPLNRLLFGNNDIKTLRIVFMFVGTKYLTNQHRVHCIKIYSNNTYTAQSPMATSGRLYAIDTSKNATFPAMVKATTFNGSAVLTGTPTAPTAAEGTNTTQIATTAFVTTAIANALADLDASEVSY